MSNARSLSQSVTQIGASAQRQEYADYLARRAEWLPDFAAEYGNPPLLSADEHARAAARLAYCYDAVERMPDRCGLVAPIGRLEKLLVL